MTTTTLPTHSRVARGGVLVVGGGFAGSYVARHLGESGATIVNPTNFMLYTPLLPEAAAGSIEPRHVAVPLRTMCPHSDLVLGSAVSLDADRRLVHVESEAGQFAIAYADLVIALGSITRMPNVPGHVLRQIELADADPETAQRRLTFVMVGGGFAGVEAIAELHELVEDALRRHPRLAHVEPRWLLVDGGPAKILGRRGIEILTETRLEAIEAGGVTLSDGRRVASDTVVWTAGIEANPLASELGLPTDAHGRMRVDEKLRVSGVPHVWSLGDCAAVPNEATPGETDPATCQHALRQARQLARNLRGTPSAYRYVLSNGAPGAR
jgi:NADH:ubiquinone reductase (H+-translocating)